jgi:predicted enzyme related to lactoylglutathione lyase
MDLANAIIGHLLIPVSDLEPAIAFYRDTLGIRFLLGAPPQMSFFQAGQRDSIVYLQVPDIRAVHTTLGREGVRFSAELHVMHRTPTMELRLAEFEDPDANHLALMSETPVQGG